MSQLLHESWTLSSPNIVGVWIISANMDSALFAVSVNSSAKRFMALFGTCDLSYHIYIWYGLYTISVTLELQHGCECPKMLSNKQVLVKDNNMQV